MQHRNSQRRTLAALGVVVGLLWAAGPAPAQTPGALTPGTPYASVRQTLIDAGYEPVAFPREGPTAWCSPAAICRAYAEISDCSGAAFSLDRHRLDRHAGLGALAAEQRPD